MRTYVLIFLLLVSIFTFSQEKNVLVGDVFFQHSLNEDGPLGDYGSKLYIGRASENNDRIFIARYNVKNDENELRINVGDDSNDKFIVGRQRWNESFFDKMFVVHTSGKVGIGIENPVEKLDVNGTIRAKEVKIEATGWPDFVFTKDYRLPSLSDVEKHIKDNGTLPNIPSEQEVKENGIAVGDIQVKLLQKVEELTLYVIEQNKTIEALKEENKAQNELIEKILKNNQ